jgi:hypothetical protein
VRIEVSATGEQSAPPSNVSFQATGRFVLDVSTRALEYDVQMTGAVDEIGGVYLHRRVKRQNGGVAYVLTKAASPRAFGRLTLTDAEVADLKAGRLYLSIVSRAQPRLHARSDLVLPPL